MDIKFPRLVKDGMRALWGRIAVETSLLGVLACVPIVSAKLSQYAIDEVVLERSMGNLWILLCMCVGCVTIVLLLKYVVAWISAITRQKFALTARLRLWSDWIDGVPSESYQPGEVANRLVEDVLMLGDIAITYVTSSVVSVITLAVCLVVLFRGNQTLAWLAVSVIPGFLVLYFVFGKRISRATREVRASIDRLVCFIVERWKQIDDIRTLQGLDYERRKFSEVVNDQFDKGMESLFVKNLSSGFAETLMAAWSLSLFAIGAYFILRDELTIGELIAVQMISCQLVVPIQRLLNLNLSLQVAKVASERVEEIEKSREAMEVKERAKRSFPVVFELRDAICHKSGIGHHDRRISIVVKTIGRQYLSGCNGSGKSSVCRIFAGLHYPVEGKFYINGLQVRKRDIKNVAAQVLLLTHKPYFFPGTIRENLIYGLECERSDLELLEVLQRVRLGSWVSALNGGLDYRLEEGGQNLSQGQCQRLNCARALLRHHEVIILDEAMSGIEESDRIAITEELGKERCLIVTRISASPRVEVSSI